LFFEFAMAAVRQSSRHAASLPLVIAKEGTDVNCRRAIDLARPDSIHLAAAVRRCGVTPQLVQYYKAMYNIVSLAQGSFRRGVKPSKRKNAVGDDDGSSSGTGSDEDANKANKDNDSAHNNYLSADDFAFFAEVKQRHKRLRKRQVDHATWAKKKAKLEKHGYMHLNKSVHYIVHACNLWDS
jgi:hypothetical protein